MQAFIAELLGRSSEPERLDHAAATSAWLAWLEKYAKRIESEADEWKDDRAAGNDIDAEREKEMRGANPRFVLRQWVLEEVIARVERDSSSGKRVLAKVMQVRLVVFLSPFLG